LLFNSAIFALFFIVIHQLFWLSSGRARKVILLLASILFYGYWSFVFLLHFLAIVGLSYLAGVLLLRQRRRWIFVLALLLNLGNLIFFKYTMSVLGILAADFGFVQARQIADALNLVLPLAISFYTFQIVAFLVDVWRGEIKEISALDFFLFILFFPQLIAGPIMRHRDFLPQLDRPVCNRDDLVAGLYLILLGTIKKVLLADELGALVGPVWAEPARYDSLSLALAVFGFIMQVYGDFSGYTDYARGLARLLGYRIPENFYYPYLASSMSEIWKRWHVTLSTWLRDYLYVPLGGSRVSASRLYVNIMIVMSLGGLWHGNSYTFFIWGFLHGLFLVLEKWLQLEEPARTWPAYLIRMPVVFLLFCLAGIFFRASDLQSAAAIFSGLVDFSSTRQAVAGQSHIAQLGLFTFALQILQKERGRIYPFLEKHALFLIPAFTIIAYFMIVRINRSGAQFIYFQF